MLFYTHFDTYYVDFNYWSWAPYMNLNHTIFLDRAKDVNGGSINH